MNYKEYKLQDLLVDDDFINWILYNTGHERWASILIEYPQLSEEVEKAKQIIIAAREVYYSKAEQSAKNSIWTKIEEQTIKLEKVNNTDTKARQFSIRPWYVAASVALLLLSSLWYYNRSSFTNSLLDKNSMARQVETMSQQRKQITLPDGSVVTLNANSKMKVSNNWDDSHTREVWLEGEAFFDVVKKTRTGAAKFIVHTSEINVEVLGTTFNVKARRGKTEVVLQSGKVRLKKENVPSFKEIVMEPGEKVMISNDMPGSVKNDNVKTEKITSWTNGKIIFEDAPLSEVAKVIEDHFSYKVVLQEDLKSELYTGELLTDSPELFFSILSKIMNVEVKTAGKQITIMKK